MSHPNSSKHPSSPTKPQDSSQQDSHSTGEHDAYRTESSTGNPDQPVVDEDYNTDDYDDYPSNAPRRLTDNNDDHPSTPAPPRIQVDTPTTPPRTLRRASVGLRSPVMSAFREHVTVDGDITPLTLDEVDARSAALEAEAWKRAATETQTKWVGRSESERAEIAAKWRRFVEDGQRRFREAEEREEKEEDVEIEGESGDEGEKEKGEKRGQGGRKKAKWEFVGR